MSSDTVVSRFELLLDAGSEPVFKGGEVITGKLRIELRSPIVINAVKLQLKGRAAWLNDPIKKDDIEKVYFDQDFILLERPPGKPEPGHFTWIGGFPYSLPFECPLPKGCITSYEGPYAYVRYFIKASLIHEEDDGRTKEYYVKKAFSIVSPSDGHLIKGEPIVMKDVAKFGGCCCKGKLVAELSLPKTGYLPGENVVGNLKIGNKYPKDILQHMEVRLVDRVVRIGAPEKASTSPYRTLYYRKIEPTETLKGKGEIRKEDFYLFTIPAVCPATKGDFNAMKNEIYVLSPSAGIMESPSTATLRFRRQPFIKIEYAIQFSLGNFVLLEAPISIGELSTHDSNNVLKPFVGGPQPIEEVDETQRIAIGGPFMYTPVYLVKSNSPTSAEQKPASDESDHPKPARRTTGEVVARKDEGSKDNEMKICANEATTDGVTVTRHEASGETPLGEASQEDTHEHVEIVTQTPLPTEGFEGEETTVTTEIIKDNGTNIIRTTTITKHPDGSESTMVQVHTTTATLTVED